MSKKPSQQRQPRAISPDLTIQPYFRGSMHTELQKFKDSGKARQLLLGENYQEEEKEDSVETTGLDLTVSEDRALHAIQILLDKTNYKGNIAGMIVASEDYKYQGFLPRLSMTYSEYFEAYGLELRGDQYYAGHQAEEAIQALHSLTQPRRIAYSRRSWRGKGKTRKALYDVIVVKRPLISIMEGYKDLEEQEATQVMDGQVLPGRVTRLVIEVSPLLVDQLDTFYLLKPVKLHSEIKQLLGGRRISRAVSLFIEWLLTLDKQTLRIGKEKLAERLRLDYLIQQRKRTALDKKLQEAFQTAKDLGYLLDYKEDPSGLVVLSLNPERCKRVSSKSRRQDEEDSHSTL